MTTRPKKDRTIVPGNYLDAWEFDGVIDQSNNQDIGPNPRLRTVTTLRDKQGKSAKISTKGELVTGQMVDDVDVNFQYIVRTAETVSNATGTGSVTHPGVGGSYAQLSPGTGVGRAELYSKAPVRYRGGHEAYCELSWIFRTPESSNWREFCGFFNGSDQFLVGYENDQFGVRFLEGGNPTFVAIGADSTYGTTLDPLDGTGPSGHNINPQAINVYRLSFVWHGGLPLALEVQVGMQWWPVFLFDFSNSIDETHLENPHLPVGGFIERTAGTGSDSPGKTGSWRGGSIAAAVSEPSDDWTAWTTLDVSLVNNQRTNIMTLRNPSTWQGKSNHIVYELGVIAFSSSANKDVAIYGTKGATLTGASGSFVFIDESNYALEWIEGGTVTGGNRGPATIIKSGGERRTDTRGTGIKIYPGEEFTIEVDAGGAVNGTFSISTRWIHEG